MRNTHDILQPTPTIHYPCGNPSGSTHYPCGNPSGSTHSRAETRPDIYYVPANGLTLSATIRSGKVPFRSGFKKRP